MEAAISSLPGCLTPAPILSTKLAKPLQTEGLEEQPEKLLRRTHSHETGNGKALAIPCSDPPYRLS